MKYHVLKSTDPFAQKEEQWKAERKCLVEEIIRLKMKCDEAFTDAELMNGFGDPPKVFVSQKTLDRRPGLKAALDKSR